MTQPPPPTSPQSGYPGGTEPFTRATPESFCTPPATPALRLGGGAEGMDIVGLGWSTTYHQQTTGNAPVVAVVP